MKKVTRNYQGIIQTYDYKGKETNYDSSINLRISKEMKEKLCLIAKKHNTTISKLLKEQFEKLIKKERV